MPATEAQMRAKARYESKAYDKICLLVPKGQRQEIQDAAKKCGCSVNAFIKEAIREKMEHITESAPVTPGPQPRRRRGFTLDGQNFKTMEDLQAYLQSQGITVTDNVILNWISKRRLSRENQEKYPLLSQIQTYDYTD